MAKQFILEVTFERSDTDKPFELAISELPKVLNLTALPTPVDTLEPYLRKAVATGAQARPILGGASFNNAPMLKPGVYEDTIRPGEELIYRVPVGWGQAPRVTATVESDARADRMLDLSGNTIDISAFNPVRGEILTTSDGPHDVYQNALYNGAEAEDVTAALPPVRLKNAGADGIYIDRAALAGDYFFSVEMGRLDEDTNFAAPMTIAVELDGKVSGVPKFSEPVKAANDDKMAKKESGTPVALWGGLGGLTVIALGGAAFFLSRRSGKPTATE
ncbi:MAG: hypothetical protein JJE02_03765 [Propionibacteriales bacterium]|nr:hypothetical protein [Propionibacteriales bacterium]